MFTYDVLIHDLRTKRNEVSRLIDVSDDCLGCDRESQMLRDELEHLTTAIAELSVAWLFEHDRSTPELEFHGI